MCAWHLFMNIVPQAISSCDAFFMLRTHLASCNYSMPYIILELDIGNRIHGKDHDYIKCHQCSKPQFSSPKISWSFWSEKYACTRRMIYAATIDQMWKQNKLFKGFLHFCTISKISFYVPINLLITERKCSNREFQSCRYSWIQFSTPDCWKIH